MLTLKARTNERIFQSHLKSFPLTSAARYQQLPSGVACTEGYMCDHMRQSQYLFFFSKTK